MKLLNQAKKFGSKVAASTTALALTAGTAMAEVPAAVQAKMDAAELIGIAIATAVLGIIVAIAVYKHIRRGA